MSRPFTLSAFPAGMTRLRSKGGASPETCYELTNCYVTASRSIRPRPSHAYITPVPTGSKGLCTFNGALYCFTHDRTLVNTGTTNLKVLRHPSPTFAGTLTKIHFAQPMMGKLYVVAEFSDGVVAHYWLTDPPVWQPNHQYKANDIIQPTAGNQKGLYFKAIQGADAAQAWTANMQYHMGSIVQPTVYNGFAYDIILINGLFIGAPTSAPSGTTEPTWPLVNGATVTEYVGGSAQTLPNDPPTPPPATPPGRDDGGRYQNVGGSGGFSRGAFVNPPPRIP